MSLAIGVDVGGTKIAAGLVSDRGDVIASVRQDTPATDSSQIVGIIAALVHELRAEHEVAGVGIGAAGFISADRSTVRFSPNIEWVDEPLAEQVGALVGVPVIVENDANAAAWGEFRFGAGEDTDDLLLVTVGTGIGGGIVHDGQLFRGGFGAAAEIGHLRVVPDGLDCGCGQRGCWEQYASGRSLVRDARRGVLAADPAAAALIAACAADPAKVTGPMVTGLAAGGDDFAIGLLATAGRWLGEGIATLCSVLDPAVVAIGGGVAAAGDLLLQPAQAAFDSHLSAAGHRPHAALRLAALGNQAGMIGAADLSRTHPLLPGPPQ